MLRGSQCCDWLLNLANKTRAFSLCVSGRTAPGQGEQHTSGRVLYAGGELRQRLHVAFHAVHLQLQVSFVFATFKKFSDLIFLAVRLWERCGLSKVVYVSFVFVESHPTPDCTASWPTPSPDCRAQFTQDAKHLATGVRKFWNTLWSVGVFTQVASNIKGFACKCAYASCVNRA